MYRSKVYEFRIFIIVMPESFWTIRYTHTDTPVCHFSYFLEFSLFVNLNFVAIRKKGIFNTYLYSYMCTRAVQSISFWKRNQQRMIRDILISFCCLMISTIVFHRSFQQYLHMTCFTANSIVLNRWIFAFIRVLDAYKCCLCLYFVLIFSWPACDHSTQLNALGIS